MQPSLSRGVRRTLGPLFVVALVTFLVARAYKGGPIDHQEILAELFSEPTQIELESEPFSFEYKKKTIQVRPVAEYEQWGLVVSHNNIKSVSDIYHDSTSVDTKDLCVIWGSNLKDNQFHDVRIWSGSWTCYYRYPNGVRFRPQELGNNHLITDDPGMRKHLQGIRIGDQIHLRGLLVDYQMDDWGKFWRRTSTVRTDAGCEVIFLKELDVLRRGTPGWYLVYRLSRTALLLIPALYLLLFWWEARNPETSRVGEL